ncbi:MAG: Uma2 family endonuclease [Acidobacteria bacterium]|nr:Uma2 family endonuclease [Acidobacteriota bacterium]
MTQKVKENAVYEDLIAAPEDKIAELVEGSLYLSPQPAIRHINATSVLAGYLSPAFHRGAGGPGGWWIFVEPELHLGENVFVPDLAGWKRERLPDLPEGVGITVAPDWVCEAISPSTERFDRLVKIPQYAAAGVSHLWIVDTVLRRLEVYGRMEREWVLLEQHSGASLVCAPPFEAIALELGTLWG